MRTEPPFTADQTAFLSALAEWSGRMLADFPTAAPPCPAVGTAEEDAVLATIFAQLAVSAPYFAPSNNLAIITSAITAHQRRYDLMLDHARGIRAGDVADSAARRTWVETKPYKAMIDVLHVWNSALLDQMLGVAA